MPEGSVPGQAGGVAADQLRASVERIKRLLEERKALDEDIKEVYAEAKGNGFDTKTIRKIVRLRKMSAEERAEEEALLDIYMAALGMLADTPLGQAAIKRLSKPKPEVSAPEPPAKQEAAPPNESAEPDDQPPAPPAPPPPTIDDARAMGAAAGTEGKPVTSNPFPAHDPRRAAFDEAWCQATGSDGMDVPEAWRRRKPAKKTEERKAP